MSSDDFMPSISSGSENEDDTANEQMRKIKDSLSTILKAKK